MVFRGCLINTSSQFNSGYPYAALKGTLMASGTGRRKMRCETGKCCCRTDHKQTCNPRAASKRNLAKEIEAYEQDARSE
jgi:hypothetical protein